jgi:hypothetical protein
MLRIISGPPASERSQVGGRICVRLKNNNDEVGTSRCDVPARVQRAEPAFVRCETTARCCAAVRGADSAARRPYQAFQCVCPGAISSRD